MAELPQYDDVDRIHTQLLPGITPGHHLSDVVGEYASTVTEELRTFVAESGFPEALTSHGHRLYPPQTVEVKTPLIGSEIGIDTGSIVIFQHMEVPVHPYGVDDLVDMPHSVKKRGFGVIAILAGNVTAEFSRALIVPFETDSYGIAAAAEGIHHSLNTPPTELK
ncbi:MAG: hypothetical protein JWM52_858 [Candidatus Saccharibacteria bacterium]|nr:hypothetical protein [Candidatus Saccharibacteria bacterium]